MSTMQKGNAFRLLAVFAFLFFAVATLLPRPAMAQAISTGVVTGTVTDPTGAVVPGAKVTIVNKQTAQSVTVTTSPTGSFSSGAMLPGDYTLRVAKTGFSTVEMPVTIQVGVASTANVKLAVGSENQVVNVEASGVQVNTEQATVQGVLTTQQIEQLPINGRNFLDLAQLQPGVQIQDGGNFDPTKNGFMSISFAGRYGRTARIEVDGIDISDETVGTTTQNIPQDAIQEFQVAQSTLDPATEETSSGTVNVVTRTGTNSFHGEGFYLFRDSSMAAHLPGPPSPYQRNQMGGRIGGPIWKDKLFFFAAGEHTLQHLAAPQVFSDSFAGLTGNDGSPFHESMLLGRVDWQIKPDNYRLFYRFSYHQNSDVLAFIPNSYQPFANVDHTPVHAVGFDFTTGNFTHSFRFGYTKFRNSIVDASQTVGPPFNPAPSVELEIGPPFGLCLGGGEAFCSGTPLLAPQSTFQANHQFKYDGTWLHHNHTIRFGYDMNRIDGGGFAGFLANGPSVGSTFSPATQALAAAGPLPGGATNPLNYPTENVLLGNGQGFSTEFPAFGFAGSGQFAWRFGAYVGDVWKARPNLTVNAALRWDVDTGRNDSDLGPITCAASPAAPPGCTGNLLDNLVPGLGKQVRQPYTDFGPQLGITWDPWSNGKTVFRGGIGLFYENVIFNNVLFDRPARLQNGVFLSFSAACFAGSAIPVAIPNGPTVTPDFCGLPIGATDPATGVPVWQAAANLENQLRIASAGVGPGPNPSFIGSLLCNGSNCSGDTMFAPNFRTPRSVQINAGVQHELRRGTVVSVDYLRNVSMHYLIGIDVNHQGDARFLDTAAAQNAIAATNGAFGCGATFDAAATDCAIAAGASIVDYANNGLDSGVTFCGGAPCGAGVAAFPGMNPNWGQVQMLFPNGRGVYNGLQFELRSNLTNPMPGFKSANIDVSYALSRFDTQVLDQDFINNATTNGTIDQINPHRFFGPNALDRTHQLSFGIVLDAPLGFRASFIGHFYSQLPQTLFLNTTGGAGDIFFSDVTGDGTVGDILPGTNIGSFGRGVSGGNVNQVLGNFNSTVAGSLSPAAQALVSAGLMTGAQLQELGAQIGNGPPNVTGCTNPVKALPGFANSGACPITPAPANQASLGWMKTFDLELSRPIHVGEHFVVEPSVAFYNLPNFANFDPAGALLLGGVLTGLGNSPNGQPVTGRPDRVGAGSGIFNLGQPRVIEWGLKLTF